MTHCFHFAYIQCIPIYTWLLITICEDPCLVLTNINDNQIFTTGVIKSLFYSEESIAISIIKMLILKLQLDFFGTGQL